MVISGLKGRWLTGVIGLMAIVAGFVVMFGASGIPEPSEEFQQTPAFSMVNVAVIASLIGGLVLPISGAARSAGPESWWDVHRRHHSGTE